MCAAEMFWESVSSISNQGGERGMDQYKVNAAFERMQLKWTSSSNARYDLSVTWRGHGVVQVLILPLNMICRQRFCDERKIKSYFIWHKGSNDKTASILFDVQATHHRCSARLNLRPGCFAMVSGQHMAVAFSQAGKFHTMVYRD